jgi:hypothetical protein
MVKQTEPDGSLTTPPNRFNFKFDPERIKGAVITALQVGGIIPVGWTV